MRPAPYDALSVRSFLAEVAEADGHPPLSEHKVMTMDQGRSQVGVWTDSAGIGLVAIASWHEGGGHWAVEAALASRRRTPTDEEAAIHRATELAAPGEPHTLWTFRTGQIAAARRVGYDEVRAVLRMSGAVPTNAGKPIPGVSITPMAAGDIEGIVAVNNRAFADHREQGSMTADSLRSLAKLKWFDPEGVMIARSDGRIAGFCITKYEGGAVGEVYLLAVAPDVAASGIGRALASHGFVWLANRGAVTAQAWVDETNRPAAGLYRTLGLAEDFRNREMAPATDVS
jgi:mycothiol synthase